MTVLDTVVAISATVCASIMSIFFGYGGIKRRTLFVKLCKRKGVWWRQWAGICIFFILLTIYAQWLFGWNRSFINMLLLASYLVAITITDLRSREIPDDTTVFYTVLFLLWNLVSSLFHISHELRSNLPEERQWSPGLHYGGVYE